MHKYMQIYNMNFVYFNMIFQKRKIKKLPNKLNYRRFLPTSYVFDIIANAPENAKIFCT